MYLYIFEISYTLYGYKLLVLMQLYSKRLLEQKRKQNKKSEKKILQKDALKGEMKVCAKTETKSFKNSI